MTEKVLDSISKELEVCMKALAKTKDINERKLISDTVRNLAESMRCFTEITESMMGFPEVNDLFEDR